MPAAAGNGQAAKICNNMMLGIQMISVCEAMALARRLGLAPEQLFEISRRVLGPVLVADQLLPGAGAGAGSPANRDYQPGFTAAMMLKDLQAGAGGGAGASAPARHLGAEAYQLYSLFAASGNEGLDFSAIIKMIEGECRLGLVPALARRPARAQPHRQSRRT